MDKINLDFFLVKFFRGSIVSSSTIGSCISPSAKKDWLNSVVFLSGKLLPSSKFSLLGGLIFAPRLTMTVVSAEIIQSNSFDSLIPTVVSGGVIVSTSMDCFMETGASGM
eukprot:NODE_191_length_13422_cov_1.451025.p8 type:complete len:110 gc:universal NODE_191_length_13422_cov_1.451025:11103-11432(+)